MRAAFAKFPVSMQAINSLLSSTVFLRTKAGFPFPHFGRLRIVLRTTKKKKKHTRVNFINITPGARYIKLCRFMTKTEQKTEICKYILSRAANLKFPALCGQNTHISLDDLAHITSQHFWDEPNKKWNVATLRCAALSCFLEFANWICLGPDLH